MNKFKYCVSVHFQGFGYDDYCTTASTLTDCIDKIITRIMNEDGRDWLSRVDNMRIYNDLNMQYIKSYANGIFYEEDNT